MKIAIVGGGLSGLSLAYYLLKENFNVTLFDTQNGASRVAAGLLHPYPGEKCQRSYRAKEALKEALELVEDVEQKVQKRLIQCRGIIKKAINQTQKENLLLATDQYRDVKFLENDEFFINSGACIDVNLYLESLHRLCSMYPLFTSIFQKVDNLQSLNDFDIIVLACGYGIKHFEEKLPFSLRYTKGQVLKLKGGRQDLPKGVAYNAKGYVAFRLEPEELILGSTYEKKFKDENVDIEKASLELIPRIDNYFHFLAGKPIIGSLSGVRVAHPNKNVPLIGRLNGKLWIITAMGSKGLLYHSFVARMLKDAIACGDASVIDVNMKI